MRRPPSSAELLSSTGLSPPQGGRASFLTSDFGRFRAAFWHADNAEPRGTAVVLPGYAECLEKYYEVVADCLSRNFAVAILDWPAQGLSDGFVPGHRITMNVYEAVLRDLILEVGRLEMPRPLVGLGHSMGGGILLSHLRENGANFKAAVLCAPMIGIAVHDRMPFLAPLARLLTALLGRHAGKLPGPISSRLTSDNARYERTTGLFAQHPALVARVPAIPWFRAAAELLVEFRASGWHDKLEVPLLVGMASRETLVSNARTAEMAGKIENSELFTVPGAMHEMLMETDERRAIFWDRFDNFLARYLP